MKKLFPLTIALLHVFIAKAQLSFNKNFYPGVKEIKVKDLYFNDTSSYYNKLVKAPLIDTIISIKKLDSLGRNIEEDIYKNKNEISEKWQYHYNDHNDITLAAIVLNMNSDNKLETSIKYVYQYIDGNILSQNECVSENLGNDKPSIHFDTLISKQDSVFTYKESDDSLIQTRILIYNKNKLSIKDKIISNHFEYTICNEYYSNGKLKSQTSESILNFPGNYNYGSNLYGTPQKGDFQYKYDYDKKGRIIKLYQYSDNRINKISEYEYIE